MKIKRTRPCKRKECSITFRLYKTTDQYCSYECFKLDTTPEQKPRTKIKPISEKRKSQSYLYTKKRKIFMAKTENKYCIVAKTIFNKEMPATEVHHKAGRRGKMLLYVPHWLAVSRKGHNWIHENPKEAYEKGFLLRSTTVNP